jgi:hypothetical protein
MIFEIQFQIGKMCLKLLMKQKRFMHHESDNALEHQIGQLVENRPYEISVTAKGRAGESRPSRTLTISPAAKSNHSI